MEEVIEDEKPTRKSPPDSDKSRDRDVSLSMAPLPIPLPLGFGGKLKKNLCCYMMSIRYIANQKKIVIYYS